MGWQTVGSDSILGFAGHGLCHKLFFVFLQFFKDTKTIPSLRVLEKQAKARFGPQALVLQPLS